MGFRLITMGAVAIAALGAAFAEAETKSVLTLDLAQKIAAAATLEAAKEGGTGAIAIVDDGGQLVLFQRLAGTFPAGADVSIGKARTAALFRKPTRVFEEIIRNGRTPMLAIEGFTPLQGGVPIERDGAVIGAVGVSGAASAQRDEEVALAGAAVAARAATAVQR
jgi:glc operon protein GlcG